MKYLSALLLILMATGCASGKKSYCDLVETEQEQIEEESETKKKPSPKPL